MQKVSTINIIPGCRGVDVEYWTEQLTNDLDALKAAAPSGDVKHLDITYYCTRELGAAETGAAYTRMTGRFIPPKSGSYRFDVKAGGKAKVFLDDVSIFSLRLTFRR